MLIATGKRLSAVVATCIALTSCDGGFFLGARVVDSEGHPLPGVKVHASSKDSPKAFEATSDQRGCLSLGSVIAPGKYTFTVNVAAPGYKPLEFAAETLDYHTFQFVLANPEHAFNSQVQALDDAQLKTHCGGR